MKLNLFAGILLLAAAFLFTGCNQSAPPPAQPTEEKVSPEEKQTRREAHALGTKLYSESQKLEEKNITEEARNEALKPVYADLEQFVFNRMSDFSNRISTITITYSRPSLQCVIYVKPGSDEELVRLKRTADSLVGRVVENLPIVKYLMVKNEQ